MSGIQAYKEFVKNGQYEKDTGGLTGKYDNVRRYWEDQITRMAIRPFLRDLVEYKKKKLERIRILDLGCGNGQGYELLTNIKRREVDMGSLEVGVLMPEIVGKYVGLDINSAMIEQAKNIYGSDEKMCFKEGDLREGLPVDKDEPPYDLYFSSYGSLSHINDEQLQKLFVDIAHHSGERCLIMGDWLGRFSYEWQDRWVRELPEENRMQDYSMSYLFSPEDRKNQKIEHFPMRYWSGDEIREVVRRASKKAGVKINVLKLMDRSIFVGRHMDTKEYNSRAPAIRKAVNMLHEDNVRTNFSDLIIDYVPKEDFDELNRFFEKLQMAWNTLVFFCMDRLNSRNEAIKEEELADYPEPLRLGIKTIDQVAENIKCLRMGDPRANIIEPQLGYALRSLEIELQKGMGCAHGIIGIFEIRK